MVHNLRAYPTARLSYIYLGYWLIYIYAFAIYSNFALYFTLIFCCQLRSYPNSRSMREAKI